MKKTKNKTLPAIALVLMLAVAAFVAVMPVVGAAVVEVDPVLFVNISPDPVGVSQSVLVTVQMDKTSPTVLSVEGGDRFTGFTLDIIKPDGTTETKGPFTAWATSGYIFYYTPSQIGTYTFQAHFPGQSVTTPPDYTGIGTTPYSPDTTYIFKPTTSSITELVVQTDPIEAYPDNPLPTEYWERPINAENKGWWQISDNWLMQGYDYPGRRFPSNTAFSPYTSAPNSAHVMWKRPLWFGGMGGGKFGDKSYYTGLSYEQPYVPLILEGRIIYTEHDPTNNGNIIGTRCLDLYTGEEIWFMEDIAIAFAQVLSFDSPNEHGLIAHLWSQSGGASNTTYQIYDGFTGKPQFTITNATRGDTIAGPNGEILNYVITGSSDNRRLKVWNSTKAILDSGSSRYPPPRAFEYYSVSQGTIADGSYGIQLDVAITYVPGALKYINLEENILITHNTDPSTFPFTYTDAAFDIRNGQLLWVKNITDVYGHYAPTRLPYSPRAIRDGIRVIYDDSKLTLHAYDLSSGEEIWVTDPLPDNWAYFNQIIDIAYDQVYIAGYDGHVRAFNAKTGNLEWDFYQGNSGLETVYNSWPIYAGITIADKKVFWTNDDHSPDSVIWRGGKLYAIDTDSGNDVWSISGWFRMPVVADGYLTATNSLDGQIYCFGKGPSKATVSAPQTVVAKGSPVMITGSVLDMSPAQPETPAVSDESMSAWMEYLHMQKPKPEDVKGVTVKLTAVDLNGDSQTIGEASTDIAGKFGKSWTPTVEGDYMIVATFEGTESFGSSLDTTYLTVGPTTTEPTPAPTPTPTPSPSPLPSPGPGEPAAPINMYLIAAAVAVVAVIVVAVIFLRKRK